ncbi:DUF3332 domain-containing protein [Vibrio europaeus]|uniref:DUF3332 domain-containing protein n=1 Tax=Vibrio europaeus TaxID=300876 RepID=A0A178J5T8_9VIBR|nr:DUF3332 domain-containing protein [Vibrio europaeus]MDC5706256.1 DUF3332 domain-containing protein [Vibrio europaeus]MDC5709666.1 DUF3332 domain-containing protein [Vibrio europaeus]MDC5714065.1 DUF3332 domain-containing protein [Vibrio europaeus]MDC5723326.1 DUF3332 domain-containing protein [Vibrio europaeus]MDC5730202.1 DUF3332 domain-containing protein [Vibrio europaeus]
MKSNALKIAIVTALGLSSLTGCMGQMATTGIVSKFNLEVVDNRYGRAGMFILLSPVYGIAGAADLFVINSIEFWTGKNPVSGKSPAVVDTPTKNYIKVNDKLDNSLKEVPLASNSEIDHATMNQIDAYTLQMDVTYANGSKKTLRGERLAEGVAFYLDDQYVTTVSNIELTDYVASANI